MIPLAVRLGTAGEEHRRTFFKTGVTAPGDAAMAEPDQADVVRGNGS